MEVTVRNWARWIHQTLQSWRLDPGSQDSRRLLLSSTSINNEVEERRREKRPEKMKKEKLRDLKTVFSSSIFSSSSSSLLPLPSSFLLLKDKKGREREKVERMMKETEKWRWKTRKQDLVWSVIPIFIPVSSHPFPLVLLSFIYY